MQSVPDYSVLFEGFMSSLFVNRKNMQSLPERSVAEVNQLVGTDSKFTTNWMKDRI